MRNGMHWITTLTVVLVVTAGASALPITADGNLEDWGLQYSNNGIDSLVTTQQGVDSIVRNYKDDNPVPRSGELFDIEAIYFTWDELGFAYAIVTSFPDAMFKYDNIRNVAPGDIALYFGDDISNLSRSSYAFGVETTSGLENRKVGGTAVTVKDGQAGGVYQVDEWSKPTDVNKDLPVNIDRGTHLGQSDFAYELTSLWDDTPLTDAAERGTVPLEDLFGPDNRRHGSDGQPLEDPSLYDAYVIEGYVAWDTLGIDVPTDSHYALTWTMSCGNDRQVLTGTTDIPEPTGLLLLAMGTAALAVRRRT